MLSFPQIDPVAFSIPTGLWHPLVVHWYALAYVAGIVLGYRLIQWLDRRQAVPLLQTPRAKVTRASAKPPAPPHEDLILYGVLGIMLGGRVGYILFYQLPFFLANPSHILKVWEGGMSFHGGFLGVVIAFALFARKHRLHFLQVTDYLAVAAPIGLFFGRLANFINGELFGRVTDAPWGMVFPRGGDLPRHPSQLYEAGLEGLVLFALVLLVATRTRAFTQRGRLSGLFVAGYGCARFTVEFFREPDAQLGFLALGATMGQLLCLPMIGLGLWLLLRRTPDEAAR